MLLESVGETDIDVEAVAEGVDVNEAVDVSDGDKGTSTIVI